MKLTHLERASDYEVEKWLSEILALTPYQKSQIQEMELVRFSKFYFYRQPKKQKASFLWRLTIILYPIYLLLLVLFLPFKWMATGKWGYGRNFIDNFHSKWVRKLGL